MIEEMYDPSSELMTVEIYPNLRNFLSEKKIMSLMNFNYGF